MDKNIILRSKIIEEKRKPGILKQIFRNITCRLLYYKIVSKIQFIPLPKQVAMGNRELDWICEQLEKEQIKFMEESGRFLRLYKFYERVTDDGSEKQLMTKLEIRQKTINWSKGFAHYINTGEYIERETE